MMATALFSGALAGRAGGGEVAGLHFQVMAGLSPGYGYTGIVIMTAFAPRSIIGIAYDSGGVTTSTITVPLVTALGVGLASSIKGRNPMIDGFGLIAFASLFPIMSVMGYAQISEWVASRSQQLQ